MKVLIIAGGEKPSSELLKSEIKECDLLIAADRGAEAYLENAAGELEHVTDTILVGNGSKGDVRIKVREGRNGLNSQLHSVLVRDLVEFEQSGGGTDDWASRAGVDLRARHADSTPTPSQIGSAPSAEADDDLPF